MDRKAKADSTRQRIELGRHIVADSKICGGQPTFKGTRIMVWLVLEQLDRGLTWQEVVREWDGRVPEETALRESTPGKCFILSVIRAAFGKTALR
ncbi:MAG TPA: DUF433 domain-containing protein, partial [Dongiaceae bacterium]|nr:DUF433 domain-containing protein [Dongiaceae bacterium]